MIRESTYLWSKSTTPTNSFTSVAKVEVFQESENRILPIKTFKEAGLHPVMLENVMLAGYDVPTPIQQFTIPAVLKGYDVVACAQTGTPLDSFLITVPYSQFSPL